MQLCSAASSGKKLSSCCLPMSISSCFRRRCPIHASLPTGLGQSPKECWKQPAHYFFISIRRTKKKDIYVISTLKRPVPLEHHLYAGKDLYKIVAANENKLNSAGYKAASDALMKRKEQREVSTGGGGGRGGAAGGRGGRGGARGGAGHKPVGRSYQAALQTDRNLYVHLIGLLNKKSLLPVVIFTFSKKRCEEYANSLSKTDLCTSLEKSEIHVFIERSLVRLRGTDKELPQILRMRELLSRGIAVHHGGLLPIIKEV